MRNYFENKEKEMLDFNKFPDLNYSLLNQEVLKIPYEQGGFPLLTTRGCPYRCAFCINVVIEENRKWRFWDEHKTIHEVKGCLSDDTARQALKNCDLNPWP